MKVKFLKGCGVALDGVGLKVVHTQPGDVADLRDDHAESLVDSKVAELADDAAVVTIGGPQGRKPSVGQARGKTEKAASKQAAKDAADKKADDKTAKDAK